LNGVNAATVERLSALRQRLAGLAARQQPPGLTEPDEGGTERWEAAQVWAHLAEFVAYWHAQLASVIDSYDGEPVPFGRTKADAARIEAIEVGRHLLVGDLAAKVDADIAALSAYLATLDTSAWAAHGLHPRRGVMGARAIVDEFVVDHLDEHARQLEDLAAAQA
jgi:hypothetical protein